MVRTWSALFLFHRASTQGEPEVIVIDSDDEVSYRAPRSFVEQLRAKIYETYPGIKRSFVDKLIQRRPRGRDLQVAFEFVVEQCNRSYPKEQAKTQTERTKRLLIRHMDPNRYPDIPFGTKGKIRLTKTVASALDGVYPPKVTQEMWYDMLQRHCGHLSSIYNELGRQNLYPVAPPSFRKVKESTFRKMLSTYVNSEAAIHGFLQQFQALCEEAERMRRGCLAQQKDQRQKKQALPARDYLSNSQEESLESTWNAPVEPCACVCDMCYDTYDKRDGCKCDDGHFVCLSCLDYGIEMRISMSQSHECCLLHPDCSAKYDRHSFRAKLSPQILYFLERLQDIQAMVGVQMEHIVQCPQCSYCEVMENLAYRVLFCKNPDCGFESCRHCHQRNHTPLTCEEFKRQNQQTEQHSCAVVIQCSCGKSILRDGGCAHIECTSCHKHSCYVCHKLFFDKSEVQEHFVYDTFRPKTEEEARVPPKKCYLYTSNEQLMAFDPELLRELREPK